MNPVRVLLHLPDIIILDILYLHVSMHFYKFYRNPFAQQKFFFKWFSWFSGCISTIRFLIFKHKIAQNARIKYKNNMHIKRKHSVYLGQFSKPLEPRSRNLNVGRNQPVRNENKIQIFATDHLISISLARRLIIDRVAHRTNIDRSNDLAVQSCYFPWHFRSKYITGLSAYSKWKTDEHG